MKDKEKNNRSSRFDWKTFLATTIVTLILSAPSWVPVFGGRYEDFKAAIVAFLLGSFQYSPSSSVCS